MKGRRRASRSPPWYCANGWACCCSVTVAAAGRWRPGPSGCRKPHRPRHRRPPPCTEPDQIPSPNWPLHLHTGTPTMSHWIAISHTEHAAQRYWPRRGFHFAREQSVVPVLLAELGKVLPHYALGFIWEGETCQPVALTGLGQGNLYLGPQGQWLSGYAPAALRGYPFRLADSPNGEKVLCIEASQLTDDPAAQPLFEEAGELAKPVRDTLEFLGQCERNRQATRQAAQALADAQVIEPWPLQVARGEAQSPLQVQGLHRISETALNGLTAEAYAELRGAPMALAYAQLLATHQLSELAQRAKQQPQPGVTPEELDSLLEGDNDDLTFDFGE
ncbi:hypothetical protein EQG41_11220 [Billgrantia azerbaijanica]|nr:hypothetical protein EQG41_11220 [Halomonas azerbaijanica]